jgi:hypothetical protein
MRTLNRYKQNLRIVGNDVYSYDTHVAEIVGNKLYKLKWRVHGMSSSVTTTKHINYVARELDLTIQDEIKEYNTL